MKQTIRYNTFETNSSSMHSLVIVKDPKPYSSREYDSLEYDSELDKFDLFAYEDGLYGRSPFQVLRSKTDKLRYYVAHYIGALKQTELIPKVINFIHEQTGICKKNIKIDTYRDYEDNRCKYKYGYAGINDTGENVFTYIEKNNISMEEFVLNPKYIVIVDGDEYQEFKKLFQSNILNANDFEYISSGPSFWNEDSYYLSLYWLDQKEREDLMYLLPDITKFIKEIEIEIDDEEILPSYKRNFKEIESFINKVKETRSDIIISLICLEELYSKVSKENLSIFDCIKLEKERYDKTYTIINLKENKGE